MLRSIPRTAVCDTTSSCCQQGFNNWQLALEIHLPFLEPVIKLHEDIIVLGTDLVSGAATDATWVDPLPLVKPR